MESNINRYNKIKSSSFRVKERKVTAFIPSPTDSDYKKGYIDRYFVQKRNDKGAPIYEVSSYDYAKTTRNSFYGGVIMKWRISGPLQPVYNADSSVKDKGVLESNKNSILLHKQQIPNLKLYLSNLRQFYKS